jgi:hypothetical protein
MQNFFHIWPNFFDKFAVNPFWDLATVALSVSHLPAAGLGRTDEETYSKTPQEVCRIVGGGDQRWFPRTYEHLSPVCQSHVAIL